MEKLSPALQTGIYPRHRVLLEATTARVKTVGQVLDGFGLFDGYRKVLEALSPGQNRLISHLDKSPVQPVNYIGFCYPELLIVLQSQIEGSGRSFNLAFFDQFASLADFKTTWAPLDLYSPVLSLSAYSLKEVDQPLSFSWRMRYDKAREAMSSDFVKKNPWIYEATLEAKIQGAPWPF